MYHVPFISLVKLGAKRKLDKFQIAEIMDRRKKGYGYGTIAKELGMKRSTVHKIVQRELGVNVNVRALR